MVRGWRSGHPSLAVWSAAGLHFGGVRAAEAHFQGTPTPTCHATAAFHTSPLLLQVVQTRTDVFVVMGHAGDSSLADHLSRVGRLPETQVQPLALQLLELLHYLHGTKYVVHQNLRLDNIMIARENGMAPSSCGLSRSKGEAREARV